ncbi:MAG: hypothetical protein AB7H48_01930 [Parachlamydiales bacterium]
MAKPTPQIWNSEAAAKQLNLIKLDDAAGSKRCGCLAQPKNQLLRSFVYMLLSPLANLQVQKN